MGKTAISLTLGEENLLWLKGHAIKGGGSLSAVLDDLISQARSGKLTVSVPPRSVVGTIDLSQDDPMLEDADETIRNLFSASLARPMMVREAPSTYGTPRRPRKPRRG